MVRLILGVIALVKLDEVGDSFRGLLGLCRLFCDFFLLCRDLPFEYILIGMKRRRRKGEKDKEEEIKRIFPMPISRPCSSTFWLREPCHRFLFLSFVFTVRTCVFLVAVVFRLALSFATDICSSSPLSTGRFQPDVLAQWTVLLCCTKSAS
ncbi:hypothetical protein C8J56DRAFT_280384 [Mycena floridula]|nr:hypothetical protein C8J56DRAFT_280384 [Mycena floridula]